MNRYELNSMEEEWRADTGGAFSARSYLIGFATGFLLLLAAAAAVNYAVDPAQLFHAGHEAAVTDELVAGRAIVKPGNYDERLLQKLIVARRATPPDTAVVGSSRILGVDAAGIRSAGTFFNHGVSGATMEDLLAVVQLLRERGRLPRAIVIGIDPWLFNRSYRSLSWQTIGQQYATIARLLGVPAAAPLQTGHRLMELVSLAYTLESVKSLANGASPRQLRPVPMADLAHTPGVPALLPDGTRRYDETAENNTEATIEVSARAYLKPPVYGVGTFRSVDPTSLRILEGLVSLLQREGVRPILLLTPYHPVVYSEFARNPVYAPILESERSVVDLGRRLGVEVRGTFDPERAGCRGADFHDGMHARRPCLALGWQFRRVVPAGQAD